MMQDAPPGSQRARAARPRSVNVADLELHERDAAGNPLLYFYARKPPEYAVYQTSERVSVHFADAPAKADEQRRALAQLAPLRGEINGLLDSWREMPDRRRRFGITLTNGAKLRKRADRFDRRVADALIVAFEGDLTGAGAVLQDVKEDVLEERVGWSRFEYLMMAIGVAVTLILLSALISLVAGGRACSLARNPLCFTHAADLWRGAMAGALGGFFSIALAIRGRTVLPDLNRTANLVDAALRVVIGSIAGVVLVALVLSRFVRLAIGDSSPDEATDLYIGITGFIAGFAERLVPDLLARAEVRTGEKPVLRKPEPDLDKPSKPGAAAHPPTAAAPAAPATAAAAEPVLDEGEAHQDACIADVEIADDEITPDENLPAASGGVARPNGSAAA